MSGDAAVDNGFLLIYGSQTGQAEAIAKEIHENSSQHGLVSQLHCMSQTEKKFSIEKKRTLVIVVSTTGEGDPPDTALKFWRRIRKKTLSSQHLGGLRYTLLGLGDTNYSNFCQNGKNFDRRLREIGASEFYPSGFADDAVGLEIVVEPWLEGLWPALRKELGLEQSKDSNSGLDQSNTTTPDLDQSKDATGKDPGLKNLNESITNGLYTPEANIENLAESEPPFALTDSPSSITSSHSNSQPPPTSAGSDDTNLSALQALTITDNDSSSKAIPSNGSTSAKLPTLPNDPSQPAIISTLTVTDDPDPPLPTSPTPLISTSVLTLPPPPPPFLELTFLKDCQPVGAFVRPDISYPFATSPVSMATVVSAQRLTREDAVKTTLGIELNISGTAVSGYAPGDSFGLICPNPEAEVELLLGRLGLGESGDQLFSLSLIPDTKKKTAALPQHIPRPCTPRQALTHCLDIRKPPKKALLRSLAGHCGGEGSGQRRLLELCSKQGSALYSQLVFGAGLTLLDLLTSVPSCRPPLVTLLEHLPRLQPRPYSVASSPLQRADRLYFALSLVEMPVSSTDGQGGPSDMGGLDSGSLRPGVCTGWLDHLTRGMQDNLTPQPSQPIQVPVFGRRSTNFSLPADTELPLVMVGPGTGVAPFIGFLQHLSCQAKGQAKGRPPTTTWLFYGCRHRDRDFIFREELELFVSEGVLSRLEVSYSREGDAQVCYVQDNLRKHGAQLANLFLAEKKCKFYVCGDAKNMAPSVYQAVLEILVQHGNMTKEEALNYITHMKNEKLYMEDVWT